MAEHIFLVCGFGRCGSSLVMQMLQAGGFPVTGEYPGFEDNIVLDDAPAAAWAAYVGKAVKSIDTHTFPPPDGPHYRALLLTRDHRQQAASQRKFAKVMMGLEFGRAGQRKLERSYRDDYPSLINTVKRLCGSNGWSPLRFEDIIRMPYESAIQIAQTATGMLYPGLNIDAMMRVIRSRSTDCLPGMLEFELIESKP